MAPMHFYVQKCSYQLAIHNYLSIITELQNNSMPNLINLVNLIPGWEKLSIINALNYDIIVCKFYNNNVSNRKQSNY